MGRFAISTIVLCVIALFLSGCATITSQDDQARINEAGPVCFNKSDCEAKWSAAKDWVLNNTKMKLHIYSNDLIMTDDPPPDSPLLACLIRKQFTTQPGVYTISIDMWCNNMFHCTPPIKDAQVDFNKFVNSAAAHNTSNNAQAIKTADFEKPKAGVRAGFVNNKVIVKDVAPGSPAQNAGLKANDVILTFDNIPITDTASLASLIQGVQFGATKQIRIQRGNEILDLSIRYPTLEETRSNVLQSEVPNAKTK